jgi:soluble lytic murein transglycosylase-like protein
VGLALPLVLLRAGEASADTFRYVDRHGRAHDVEVSTAGATPALRPTEAEKPQERATRDADAAKYLVYVNGACTAYKVPLPLVLAVMKVESGFNPRAVSDRGAMGLMQLMPATAADLGVVAPFDPQQNIDGGVRYLRELLDAFSGDLRLALAAYHAGPKRVRRAQGVPFEVTRRYVQDVLRAYERYRVAGSGVPAG